MEEVGKDGHITLDETVSDSLISATDSMNNSKRKASDSDSDGVIESVNARKRLCHEEKKRPGDSEIIAVVFESQDIARKYSKKITEYICQLTKSEITTSAERNGKPCIEFYQDSDEPRKPKDAAQSVKKLRIDSTDALPTYDQTFSGAIGMKTETKQPKKAKPKNMCFNCEGDHMIAACPEPRDAGRIAKNRSAHASKNTSYSRYHEESDQRFGHLAPGTLSAGLREALGLSEAELPLHTYRMRVQGYPPGWLRAARQQRSNLSVHHEPAPVSDKDDGRATEKEEEEHYDLNKLISFPGFNVPCPNGCRDNHHRMGFPPLSRFWSLRAMRQRLRRAPAARKAGQRGRAADLPSSIRHDQRGKAASNGAGTTGAEPTANGDREGSPSLEALEEQRRALLDSLEDGEDGELEEDDEEEDPEEEVSELVHAPPAAASTPQTPVLTPGASRRRELGTPVAARGAHVVYDAEKWSAGITEHIPYENLPGATGAWDRMSSLMKKVRDQLTGKN